MAASLAVGWPVCMAFFAGVPAQALLEGDRAPAGPDPQWLCPAIFHRPSRPRGRPRGGPGFRPFHRETK